MSEEGMQLGLVLAVGQNQRLHETAEKLKQLATADPAGPVGEQNRRLANVFERHVRAISEEIDELIPTVS